MLTPIKHGEVLTRHLNTDPHCGAAGPILYSMGRAWSVNSYEGGLTEFRFGLDELRNNCKECERHKIAALKEAGMLPKDEREALLRADHKRLRGMPISVQLNPAQIAALAAAAEFIIDNGGFPDNEELTEHLRNALKVLDE